jgi:glycosyltransferase involved in cell wall biosynthesis
MLPVEGAPAKLACGVLSLGAEPGVVDAVRSLLDQVPRPEVIVVNSGGGDPQPRLRAAGLDVPVVNLEERLLPGGARNVAIDHTSAPYVAFLAADCVAEPGWVAARLRAHEAGAAAVSSVLTVEPGATRSECAAHLLLHHRRTPDTPPAQRLFFGLSYSRFLFDRYGRFREDLRQGEDSDFNGRLRALDVVAWAPTVRTIHLHPKSPGALLGDQYARGRRRAIALLELSPERAWRKLVHHALTNVLHAARLVLRTSDRRERALLLSSWPLLGPASLAYVAGGFAVLIRRTLAPDRSAAGATRSRP